MNACGYGTCMVSRIVKTVQMKPCFLGVTQVRFRKTRFQPKAPSKMYDVKPTKVFDRVETEKLERNFPEYKTALLSINAKITEMVQARGQTTTNITQVIPDEEALAVHELEQEFLEKLQINESWNQEIALAREERLKREEESLIQLINEKTTQKLAKIEQRQAEAVKILSRRPTVDMASMEDSELDKELDKVLDAPPSNYEYAIES